MSKLTVVGSINADLIVHAERHPQPGETLLGSGGDILAGGKGANQAVAAAQLGATVAFVGAVGSDPYAEPAMHYMRTSGIDLGAVEQADTNTGLAVITVSADGENTIVISPGANALVDAPFVSSRASTIADADVVLLQGEIPASGFQAAVQAAQGRVVVNLAPVVAVDRDSLLQADPLLANEHEAGLILDQLGLPAEGAPRELAHRLVEAGFRSVVLTLGAHGAYVATPEGGTGYPHPARDRRGYHRRRRCLRGCLLRPAPHRCLACRCRHLRCPRRCLRRHRQRRTAVLPHHRIRPAGGH